MGKWRIFVFIILVISLTSIFSDCEEKEEYKFEVTSNITRQTIPANQTQSTLLVIKTDSNRTSRTDKVDHNISDISISSTILEGTGILPFQGYVSMTFQNDESNTPGSTSGNYEWIKTHTNKLAVCSKVFWIQNAQNEYNYVATDTAVNVAQPDDINAPLHPIYNYPGASYLAEIKNNDVYIPWIHPEVPTTPVTAANLASDSMHLDMNSLTGLLFSTLSGAVTGTVAGLPTFTWDPFGGVSIPVANVRLGGPNRDGNFKLRFVPQLQSNENGDPADTSNQVVKAPGVAFIFEASIDVVDAATGFVSFANFKIYLPAFLTFEVNVNGDFQVDFEPIASIARGESNPFGFDKIVVLSNTPLGVNGQQTADGIRESLKTGMSGMAGALGIFTTSTIAFSSGFNKYREGRTPDGYKFDIITVPTECVNHTVPMCWDYNGYIDTQVQPQDGNSTRIATFILFNF